MRAMLMSMMVLGMAAVAATILYRRQHRSAR